MITKILSKLLLRQKLWEVINSEKQNSLDKRKRCFYIDWRNDLKFITEGSPYID